MTDPVIAFVLGAVAALLAVLPAGAWAWRQRTLMHIDHQRKSAENAAWHDMVETGPDGVFAWMADGTTFCSRRLAIILDLANGVQSDEVDVRGRFTGEATVGVSRAIDALRGDGVTFDLLLPLANGRRTVHVAGTRASTADGTHIADVLWVRDSLEDAEMSMSVNVPAADLSADQEWVTALLDALPLPVWLRDANLNLAFVNQACADESVAETTHDLACNARAQGAAAAEPRLLALGATPRLFEVTEAPLGAWPGTVGYAIDRSATEELEGAFARDTAAREQILESLSTAIAIFGTDAKMVFANTVYAEMFGLDPVWFRSEPNLGEVLERLRERRKLPEVADFRKFKQDQLSRFGALDGPSEELLHLPDGTTLRSVVTPYPLGGLVFVYEDVTERLALERSLNTLIAVQRETLDNLYEGVSVWGSDGRLRLTNPVFAYQWHLSDADLEDQPHVSAFVEQTKPLLREGSTWDDDTERLAARLMSREPFTGRIMRTDETVLDYATVPLPDGAVLLSFLDVSDRTRVEDALRQRADALHDANRLKSEFIAGVAHEIRTPMNTIIGFAEILSQTYFGNLNKRQSEYVQGIVDTSQTMMSVVGDILDLATIEAGVMTLSLDTVDVHALLAASLQLVRDSARRKSQTVEFDCPPDVGWIVADERRLRQILFNLLSNAVKFTRPRGQIKLAARRDTDEVVITISDTGIGIAGNDQERVFQSFERVRIKGEQTEGAGLGLSLVKRFVELHGGRIELKSRPGRGTTVSCWLPIGGVG